MSRMTLALLVVCSLLGHEALGQSAPDTGTPDRATLLAVAREVMEAARYCDLVTIGEDGRPQARVVDPFAPEQDFTVWIATKPVTRKVAQIRSDPRVTLFYFDRESLSYVTVLGDAELVTDAAERSRHWKPEWAPFYADGSRGDDYLLIRVTPRRIEVLSPGRGVDNDPVTWRPAVVDLR